MSKKNEFIIAFLSVSLSLFCARLSAQDLKFTIIPEWADTNKASLLVTSEFQGDADGETWLYYANNQFGEDNQIKFIDFNLPNQDVTYLPDSNRVVFRHAPGARVTFKYRVFDRQGDQDFYSYCCYNPILKPTYLHIQSGHLLIYPEELWSGPTDRRQVSFEWQKTPEDWVTHSSFGAGLKQGGYLTQGELGYGVFVAGDFRKHTFHVKGQPVHFLTRGNWQKWTDTDLLNILQRTFEGHRALWNDFTDTIYTVTFIPVDMPESNSQSCGGSGLTNSFLSYATNHAKMDLWSVRYVYVHELMHRWIGTTIENEKEEQQYWFSEGFTDYFTYKTMLRYELIDMKEWAQTMNREVLTPHYLSTVKGQPNSEINYEHFWNGGKDWEKLPYRRGCIYAFYLDNLIRKRSKGKCNLDDVLRDMLQACTKNPEQKLNHDFFLRMIEPYAGKSCRADFEKYIVQGKPIKLDQIPLPKGLKVVKKSGSFSTGSSPEQLDKTVYYQNLPAFAPKKGVNFADLRAEIIR